HEEDGRAGDAPQGRQRGPTGSQRELAAETHVLRGAEPQTGWDLWSRGEPGVGLVSPEDGHPRADVVHGLEPGLDVVRLEHARKQALHDPLPSPDRCQRLQIPRIRSNVMRSEDWRLHRTGIGRGPRDLESLRTSGRVILAMVTASPAVRVNRER